MVRTFCLQLVIVVVVVLCVVSEAPGQRGGRQSYDSLAIWFMPDQLLTHDEIVRDLKLTANQQESIRTIWKQYYQAVAAIPQRTPQNSKEVSQKFREAASKRIASILELLGDKAKRLDQISAQSAGPAAAFVTRPNRRAPRLELTAEQLAKGREILAAVYKEMPPGRVSAERRKEFVDKTTPKLLELLTNEQKNRWQEATGDPVPETILAVVRGGTKPVRKE